MKRILLINPATPGYAMNLFPPLTLAVLAGAIPEGYQVSIVDENVEDLSLEGDLAAITANTYSIRRAYEIAALCRQKGIPVVLGGNHPSIMPEEASSHGDSVVIGDGEGVWAEFLQDFEGKQLKKYYTPPRYHFQRPLRPRRELLSGKYRFESLETSRGCPYNCSFCSVTRFHGAAWRLKPPEQIEEELRGLQGKNLFLVDDNIIGRGQDLDGHIQALLELFKQYRIRWMGQASINVADDPRLLEAMAESGCLFLFIGFESLNSDVLKSLNKRLNYRREGLPYGEVIRRIHRQGISIMGSFIIGSDHDTRESILELKDFIRRSEIDIPNITHLTPYPGTRVYEELQKEKRLFHPRFWLQDPFPIFAFEPRRISTAELRELTLELLAGYMGLGGQIRRFFNTLKNTRSLRKASYSLAESMINVRGLKQQLG